MCIALFVPTAVSSNVADFKNALINWRRELIHFNFCILAINLSYELL